MNTKQNITQSGFSIIEVIVFASLLSMVLVAAVGYTVRLVFTMTHNKHKLLATYYVDEVREWLNGERESDWDLFQGKASVAGQEYCMNAPLQLNTNLSSLRTGSCGYSGITGNNPQIYRRVLIMRKDRSETANQVNALIRVSWYDDGTLYTEERESAYSVWE